MRPSNEELVRLLKLGSDAAMKVHQTPEGMRERGQWFHVSLDMMCAANLLLQDGGK
jgi:hypothetical protein